MPGSVTIGRVAIKVVPDTRNFRKEVKAKLDSAAEGIKVEIPTELDTSGLREELKNARRVLQAYADALPVKIRTQLDRDHLSEIRDNLADATRNVTTRIDIDVDEGLRKAGRDIRNWAGKHHFASNLFDPRDFSTRAMERQVDHLLDVNRRWGNSLESIRRQYAEVERGGDSATRSLNDETNTIRRRWDLLGRTANRTRAGTNRLLESLRNINRETARSRFESRTPFLSWGQDARSAGREMRRSWNTVSSYIGRSNDAVNEHRRILDRTRRSLGRFEREWHHLGNTMGRTLGRGSRNNFLHLLGGLSAGIIQAPIRILGALARSIFGVVDALKSFQEEGFKAGFKALANALSDPLGAIIGILGALGALLVIGPPILVLLQSLVAVLVGITGSLVIGLAGILLPLLPIVAALGVSLGVVVAGIMSLRDSRGNWDLPETKAFKRLQGTLKDFKKTLRGVAQDAAPSFANLANTVLGGLEGVVKEFGTRIGFAVDDLLHKIKDPKQQKIFKKWGDYLPAIFSSIANGANSLGLALINFLTPVLPYAKELADGFQDLMDKFLNWTKSAKGQNSIKDFMQHAWDDAKKLSSIITDLTVGIAELLNMGSTNGGGDDFLSWLEGKMKDFRKWAGGDGAKKWFEDAKKSVNKFLDAINSLGQFLAGIDWAQARKDLDGVSGAISNMANAFKLAGQIAQAAGAGVILSIKLIGKAVKALSDIDWSSIWDGIKGGAQQLWDWFITPWKKVGDAIVAPFKWAYDILLGHSIIPDIVNGIIDWLSGLPGDIIVALAGVPAALAQPFIDGFNMIPEPIREGAGIVGSAVSSIWSSSPLVSAFRMGKQLFKGSGSDMAGEMTTSLGDLRKMIGSKVALVPPAVAKGLAPLPRTVKQSFTGISNPALAGIGRLRSDMSGQRGFGGLPGKAASALSPLSGRVSGKFTNASVSSLHAIASMTTQVLDRFGAMARAIPRAMDSMGGALYSAGLNAMYGLRNGISRGGSVAIAAARAVAYAVSAITRAVLDIRSPSRVMASIGVYIPQGLAMGITSGLPYVRNATQTMATSVSSLMTDAFNMTNQGRSAMQSLADGMRSGLRPVASAIATADGLVTGMTPGAAVSQRVASTNLYVPEERYSAQPFPSDMEFQLAITGLETGVMTAVKRNPVRVAEVVATGDRKRRTR